MDVKKINSESGITAGWNDLEDANQHVSCDFRASSVRQNDVGASFTARLLLCEPGITGYAGFCIKEPVVINRFIQDMPIRRASRFYNRNHHKIVNNSLQALNSLNVLFLKRIFPGRSRESRINYQPN